MGVPKGSPKHGGRAKGSKNLDKIALEQKIADSGFDPITAMCRIGIKAEAEGDYLLAVQCAKELANYQHAKKRSVEVKQDNAEPITFHLTTSKSLQILDEAMENAGITREPPLPAREVAPVKASPPEALLSRVADGHEAKSTEFIPAPAVEASPAASWTPLNYPPSTNV